MRFSKPGGVAAGLFVLLYGATRLWLAYSASTNPADSGEGGLLLLGFAFPWVLASSQPDGLALIGMTLLNAAVIYVTVAAVARAMRWIGSRARR